MNTFKFIPTLLQKDLWRGFSLKNPGNLNKIILNGRAKEADGDTCKQINKNCTSASPWSESFCLPSPSICYSLFFSFLRTVLSLPLLSPPVLFTTTSAWPTQQQTTGPSKVAPLLTWKCTHNVHEWSFLTTPYGQWAVPILDMKQHIQ